MQLDIFQSSDTRISPSAKIGKNVKIGARTIIYDNVEIGDDTIICNDCVIGEPLNDYYSQGDTYQNPPTKIGANSLIRSHTIIYAGNVIGDYFQTGHRTTIREENTFGHHCSVGTLGDIQGYSTFGNYCRLHSNVFVAMHSTLGDFVFIYPHVVITDDPTPPSNISQGATIGKYSQIAAGSILMPGIHIGEHCLVASGSIVTKNVADYQLMVGQPAQFIKDVREITDRETGDNHYPWPYRYDHRMPWKEMGYDAWMEGNKKTINND